MPLSSIVSIAAHATAKIAEVNERRETLSIFNPNPYMLALADDDAPIIQYLNFHGIPIYPNSMITLERKDGDQPQKAWYIYAAGTSVLVIFEGMTVTPRRWW